MQVGVRNVAYGGKKIYAHVRRLGDTGWGTILRMNSPESVDPNEASGDTLDRRLTTYKNAIGSVEILKRSNHRGRLCASADGNRVFFTVEDEPFLVEDGGEAKSLATQTSPSARPQSTPPKTTATPQQSAKPEPADKPMFRMNLE
jgi:hypothetical protein